MQNNYQKIVTKRHALLCLVLSICLGCLSGCKEPRSPQGPDYPAQIEQLQNELQQAQLLIKQKDQQIVNLQKLPDNYIEHIISANKINLGRYTRVDDTNGDLKVDSLVVYLQIMDKSEDKVKIAGSCTIELWDLDAAEDRNLVKSWTFSPTEFETYWDGVLASEYRFILSADEYRPAKNNLTVKCRFNELISGKTWEAQKMLSLDR